jgi:hypothetical protein
MDARLVSNFLDPAILFFFFGVLAGGIRSNLEIPASIAKFFSLYLLVAIGFKGGVALASSGVTAPALAGIGAAMFMAVLLASWVRNQDRTASLPSSGSAEMPPGTVSLRAVLHEAFTDGAHLLLIGSLTIGLITGENGRAMMAPFTADIFKGILAFFLLEMGLLVARQLREARGMPPFLRGDPAFS